MEEEEEKPLLLAKDCASQSVEELPLANRRMFSREKSSVASQHRLHHVSCLLTLLFCFLSHVFGWLFLLTEFSSFNRDLAQQFVVYCYFVVQPLSSAYWILSFCFSLYLRTRLFACLRHPASLPLLPSSSLLCFNSVPDRFPYSCDHCSFPVTLVDRVLSFRIVLSYLRRDVLSAMLMLVVLDLVAILHCPSILSSNPHDPPSPPAIALCLPVSAVHLLTITSRILCTLCFALYYYGWTLVQVLSSVCITILSSYSSSSSFSRSPCLCPSVYLTDHTCSQLHFSLLEISRTLELFSVQHQHRQEPQQHRHEQQHQQHRLLQRRGSQPPSNLFQISAALPADDPAASSSVSTSSTHSSTNEEGEGSVAYLETASSSSSSSSSSLSNLLLHALGLSRHQSSSPASSMSSSFFTDSACFLFAQHVYNFMYQPHLRGTVCSSFSLPSGSLARSLSLFSTEVCVCLCWACSCAILLFQFYFLNFFPSSLSFFAYPPHSVILLSRILFSNSCSVSVCLLFRLSITLSLSLFLFLFLSPHFISSHPSSLHHILAGTA